MDLFHWDFFETKVRKWYFLEERKVSVEAEVGGGGADMQEWSTGLFWTLSLKAVESLSSEVTLSQFVKKLFQNILVYLQVFV